MRELEAGRTIDVAPMPSAIECEKRLLPILIPINKGMLGWRQGLIRKGEQDALVRVRTLEDLNGVRLGKRLTAQVSPAVGRAPATFVRA